MTIHVNKVSHVTTINRVAKDLGESEDWLFDVANEMEPEDGVIWVHGVGDEGVMAFTDFGIENLSNSSKSEKATHAAQARRRRKIATLRSTPHGYGAIRGEGSVLGLEGLRQGFFNSGGQATLASDLGWVIDTASCYDQRLAARGGPTTGGNSGERSAEGQQRGQEAEGR